MISFKQELESVSEEYAYYEGVKAFLSGYHHKLLVSPFTKGCYADTEWLNGFYDAKFMYFMTRCDKHEPRD